MDAETTIAIIQKGFIPISVLLLTVVAVSFIIIIYCHNLMFQTYRLSMHLVNIEVAYSYRSTSRNKQLFSGKFYLVLFEFH